MRFLLAVLLAPLASTAAAQPSLTARGAETVARAAAEAWVTDPAALQLYSVLGGQCGWAFCAGLLRLDPETGTSPNWVVQYLTGPPYGGPYGSAPTVLVRVENGTAAVMGTYGTNFAQSIESNWLDSAALVPATLTTSVPGRPQWTGRAFLDAYPEARVSAFVKSSQPDEFQVMYYNPTPGCQLSAAYGFNLYTGRLGPNTWAPGFAPGSCPPPVAGEGGPNEASLTLSPPHPNPVRLRADVPFTLGSAADVRLDVVDVLGRTVATLFDGPAGPGRHTATWKLDRVPPGVYMLRLEAGGSRRTAAVTVSQ